MVIVVFFGLIGNTSSNGSIVALSSTDGGGEACAPGSENADAAGPAVVLSGGVDSIGAAEALMREIAESKAAHSQSKARPIPWIMARTHKQFAFSAQNRQSA